MRDIFLRPIPGESMLYFSHAVEDSTIRIVYHDLFVWNLREDASDYSVYVEVDEVIE